jgi:hydroxymethylpyrimidine pyrophosphatase-like HAD family hydrolase
MLHYLIFTYLDGTLLDSKTYSYEKSLAAINRLKETEIEQCRYQGKEGRWR